MAMVIREDNVKLEPEENLIALKILLVIYLHDKRYLEALEDIDELLKDSEMQGYREYLLLRQKEVRQLLCAFQMKRRRSFYRLFSTSFIMRLNEVLSALAIL